MNNRMAKRFKRMARKQMRYNYHKFLRDMVDCTFRERLIIAKQVLFLSKKKADQLEVGK